MRERKHLAKGSRFRRLPVLLGFVAGFLLLLGGAAFAGYRYDQSAASRLLPGIHIQGVDVGGMTRAEAVRALQGPASKILDRQLTVRVGGRTWTSSAQRLGTSVDVAGAVDRALSLSDSLSWPSRVYHRLLHKPVAQSLSLAVTYDHSVVEGFVHDIGQAVDRDPRNANLDVIDGKVVKTHALEGRTLKAKRASARVMDALTGDASSVRLALSKQRPRVTDENLGKTIVVRVGENRLYLYDGFDLIRTYSVATGQPQYPTPLGHWAIVDKRINPTWVNPARDSWGADEPAFIPPGPDNPLGTRAMDLNAPGIRIHGTPNDASIGTHASHGCIRMHIPDSEALFALVDVGTPVIIVA
jgi:lipoprotein-anchoring transpeptidase ErfK/SrfK